jgi:hypothetical protein
VYFVYFVVSSSAMLARDNPFASHCLLEVRYRLAGMSWEALLARLAGMDYRAAIVGPKGSGKTTLMEDLEPRLIASGYRTHFLRLTEEEPAFARGWERAFLAGLSTQEIVLLDGAEQMSGRAWWRWRRGTLRAGGLLITSHQPGLLPTVLECHTTPALLGNIVAQLLPGPERPDEVKIRRLHAKHAGNLREALRELYDVWAERKG